MPCVARGIGGMGMSGKEPKNKFDVVAEAIGSGMGCAILLPLAAADTIAWGANTRTNGK